MSDQVVTLGVWRVKNGKEHEFVAERSGGPLRSAAGRCWAMSIE